MTREEAINEMEKLDEWISKQPSLLEDWCKTSDAIDMAIKSLKVDLAYEEVSEDNRVKTKDGNWIFTKTIFDRYGCTVECSFCHKKWKTYDEIRFKKEYKFCPNCGTKMIEAQESEE